MWRQSPLIDALVKECRQLLSQADELQRKHEQLNSLPGQQTETPEMLEYRARDLRIRVLQIGKDIDRLRRTSS